MGTGERTLRMAAQNLRGRRRGRPPQTVCCLRSRVSDGNAADVGVPEGRRACALGLDRRCLALLLLLRLLEVVRGSSRLLRPARSLAGRHGLLVELLPVLVDGGAVLRV